MCRSRHRKPVYFAYRFCGKAKSVYICLCNGLTEEQIIRVVAEGALRPRQVYTACGCQAQCGSCTRTILEILRAGSEPIEGAAAPARRAWTDWPSPRPGGRLAPRSLA